MIKRVATLTYGVICYFAFFLSFNYFVFFVGNIFIPNSIDAAPSMPVWQAMLINIGLVLAFALQHSIMARPWFKNMIAKVVPHSIERSTFVLAASIGLTAIMVFWQPVGGVVWSTDNVVMQVVLYSLFALGVVMIFLASFLINHFDLFGLRQTWLAFVNKPYTEVKFGMPFLYKVTRHPLYLGLVIMLWAAPTMTISHLVLAILMTTYIVVAIQFEEKDLVTNLGEKYADYQRKVPMLIPGIKPRPQTHPIPSNVA